MPGNIAPHSPAVAALLARLSMLFPRAIDLKLDRLQGLLERLGHPERELPPVFHVGGTNGKGSTVALLRAMLEAAGHRVHVYSSPHLVRFHERIRLAGTLIDDRQLIEVLERVERAARGQEITLFEATTAAAFLAFSETPADALVLEVGLGGRLDATNVVERPVMTVISHVALDHQSYLGNTLSEIATEKAGIAKSGVPLVTRQQDRWALRAIEKIAAAQGAKLLLGGRDWSAEASGAKLLYRDATGALALPGPKLVGAFQYQNAALAVAALRHQKALKVPVAALRAGLGWAEWPARLQRLNAGKLIKLLPPGSTLWLDGGHNPDAALALAAHFKGQLATERPFHMVVGMLRNRDPRAFLKPFAGQVASATGIMIEGEDCHRSAEIAAAASAVGITGRLAGGVAGALEQIAALHKNGPAPVVLVAGSLYLAGKVLLADGQMPG